MRTITYSICALLVLAGHLIAKEEKNGKPELPGTAVGAKAPDFKLRDQNDKEVELKGLLKNGPVAVVFHRSASW